MHAQADLQSHHIEGLTKYGQEFSVPLYSRITDTLWLGGCPEDIAPEKFRFILNLYPWAHYDVYPHQVLVSAALEDGPVVPDEATLLALARFVNVARAHGQTLVHCQAGLNRAALVAALALIEDGSRPAEAIALLRARRSPAVLCNPAFEQWLLSRSRE